MSVRFQEAVNSFASQVALQRQLTQATTDPKVTDQATAVFRALSADSFDYGSHNRAEPTLSSPMPDPRTTFANQGINQPASFGGVVQHIGRMLQDVTGFLNGPKPTRVGASTQATTDTRSTDSTDSTDDTPSTDGVTPQLNPVEMFRANRAQEAYSLLTNSATQRQSLPPGVESMLMSRLTPDQRQAYEDVKTNAPAGTQPTGTGAKADPQTQTRMAQLTLELALSNLDDLFNRQMSGTRNFRPMIN